MAEVAPRLSGFWSAVSAGGEDRAVRAVRYQPRDPPAGELFTSTPFTNLLLRR